MKLNLTYNIRAGLNDDTFIADRFREMICSVYSIESFTLSKSTEIRLHTYEIFATRRENTLTKYIVPLRFALEILSRRKYPIRQDNGVMYVLNFMSVIYCYTGTAQNFRCKISLHRPVSLSREDHAVFHLSCLE